MSFSLNPLWISGHRSQKTTGPTFGTHFSCPSITGFLHSVRDILRSMAWLWASVRTLSVAADKGRCLLPLAYKITMSWRHSGIFPFEKEQMHEMYAFFLLDSIELFLLFVFLSYLKSDLLPFPLPHFTLEKMFSVPHSQRMVHILQSSLLSTWPFPQPTRTSLVQGWCFIHPSFLNDWNGAWHIGTQQVLLKHTLCVRETVHPALCHPWKSLLGSGNVLGLFWPSSVLKQNELNLVWPCQAVQIACHSKKN